MLSNIIKDRRVDYKPIWFMRQAGRHLKDYRKLRLKHTNFIQFCLDEDSIIEATLMPMKHYNLDAAIIFSDILIIPWLLEQKIEFIKNFGPKLTPLVECEEILENSFDLNKLVSIKNAISKVKSELCKNKDLIGFSGAPWTLACYMIEGHGSRTFEKTRRLLWKDRKLFNKLINKLTTCIVDFLEFQAKAGADILMIFDTWSHMIPSDVWKEFAIDPIKQIISDLKSRKIYSPIIGFPFKAGEKIVQYSYETGVDVVSVDWNTDLNWVCKNINKEVITQGNLDPLLLTVNNVDFINKSVTKILNTVENRAHIFNVGHGITPGCLPENVKHVIKLIRK